MPRKNQTPLKVTVTYRLRTPEEKKQDYARWAQSLTPAQQRALLVKLERELAEEKQAAKQTKKGGQTA